MRKKHNRWRISGPMWDGRYLIYDHSAKEFPWLVIPTEFTTAEWELVVQRLNSWDISSTALLAKLLSISQSQEPPEDFMGSDLEYQFLRLVLIYDCLDDAFMALALFYGP